eukprot:6214679-Pleurochrysis_carterae.AAC.2
MGVRVRVGSACVCGAARRAGCNLTYSYAMRCGLTCACAGRLDARVAACADAPAVPRRPTARRCPNLRMPTRKPAAQQHTSYYRMIAYCYVRMYARKRHAFARHWREQCRQCGTC